MLVTSSSLVLLLCFGFLSAEHATIDFELDKKQWEIAYEGGVDNFKIVEYVPKGQSLNDWSELISVVDYDGISETPQNVFKAMIQELQARAKGSEIESCILDDSKDSVVAKWSLRGGKIQDENNWVKIIAKDNEIHTLLITSKETDQTGAPSKVWEKMLKTAKLEKK